MGSGAKRWKEIIQGAFARLGGVHDEITTLLLSPTTNGRTEGRETEGREAPEPAGSAIWRTVGLGLSLAVTLFVAARRLGPLVVPVGLGAVWATMRRRRRGRARRVRRLAAWALHAPWVRARRKPLRPCLQRTSLPQLVGIQKPSVSHAPLFRRADPWQRELGLERLTRAERVGSQPGHDLETTVFMKRALPRAWERGERPRRGGRSSVVGVVTGAR